MLEVIRMRKAILGSFVVSSIAAIVVACGGSDGSSSGVLDPDGGASSSSGGSSSGSSGTTSSSGGPSGNYGPAQPGQGTTYCDSTYEKLTDAFALCCSEADKKTIEYGFGVGLLTAAIATCGPKLEDSIAKGRLEYDAAAASSCYAGWMSIFSGNCTSGPLGLVQNLDKATLQSQIAACKVVFRGKVAENGACGEDADCLDGLTCVGWTAKTEGVCKKPPAIGEACGQGATDGGSIELNFNVPVGDHPPCATGAYCASRKCAAQKNPGETCTDDKQCAGGKLCRLGVCGDVDDADQGGPCKQNDDCKSGLYCQVTTLGQVGSCQPKQGTGAACTSSVSSCKGRCDRPDSGTNGTCVPFCGSE